MSRLEGGRAEMGNELNDVQRLKNKLEELNNDLDKLNNDLDKLNKTVEQLKEQGKKRRPHNFLAMLREYNFLAMFIGCALIGALSWLALWRFDDLFKEAPQLTAALGLAFGAIVGLIGTYFGIKESHEARQEAHSLANKAVVPSDATPPKKECE
jgi:F0F1-type ATP synthase assembly protein I